MTGPVDPPAPSSANLLRRRRTALAGVAVVAVTAVTVLAMRSGGEAGPALLGASPEPTATYATTSPTPAPTASVSPLPSATPVPSGGTRVVEYSPYRPDGSLAPGVDVVAEARAACRPGVLSRNDAFRCAADPGHEMPDGQNQFEPCFRSPRVAAELICPRSPRGDRAVRIRHARFAPYTEPDHGDGTPWYLELADGQRCWWLSGASTTYAGMRANYECPDGVLFGDPDRSAARWTIQYAKDFRPRSRADLSTVAIVMAWY